MHALVEFLLERIAEDRVALQWVDERYGTRFVPDCNRARRIVELVGIGLADGDRLANDDVLLRLARPYCHHPEFCIDWQRAART